MNIVPEFRLRKATLACPLIIAALTLAAFLPSLSNGFTNWDDPLYVTQNPLITSLSWHTISAIFTTAHRNIYAPLVLASYAVEYRFFGLNPAVYHATNLLLHIFNALLVYFFLSLVTGRKRLAFAATLLFALHPLRVESVAWVSERKDVLYAFFALLSLVFHALRRRGGGNWTRAASITALALSLLANAKAVPLPFIILLLDWHAGAIPFKKSVKDSLPYFAIAAVFGLINYATLHHAAGAASPGPAYLLKNIFAAACGFLVYIGKTLWPVRLSALYPYPAGYPQSLPAAYWLAPPALIALVLLFARFFRGNRTAILGGAFFAVWIFPFLQWLPIQPGVVMEHLSYMPSVGLSLVLAELLSMAARKHQARHALLAAGFAAALLALCVLTWQRTRVWKNSFTLWNDRIARHPDSTLAYINRGAAYQEAGRLDEAVADFDRALKLNPALRAAWVKLGFAQLAQRKLEDAEASADKALSLAGGQDALQTAADAHYLKGSVRLERGDLVKADAAFDSALAARPDYGYAFAGKGKIALAKGDARLAAGYFAKAAAQYPLAADLWNALAAAQSIAGDTAAAIPNYKKAVALNPRCAQAWANLAIACFDSGDTACAQSSAAKAAALGHKMDPAFLRAYP